MLNLEDTPGNREIVQTNFGRFVDLAERYRADPALRARIDSGDVADSLADLGIELGDGLEARIVVDSADIHHVVLPPDPNMALSDESLAIVAGGKTAGTAGTIGSASTFACGTVPSSVSSAGSAGTVGSAS